jgi:hypothetical protein
MHSLNKFFSFAFAIILLSTNTYLGVSATPIANPGGGVGSLNPAAWLAVQFPHAKSELENLRSSNS